MRCVAYTSKWVKRRCYLMDGAREAVNWLELCIDSMSIWLKCDVILSDLNQMTSRDIGIHTCLYRRIAKSRKRLSVPMDLRRNNECNARIIMVYICDRSYYVRTECKVLRIKTFSLTAFFYIILDFDLLNVINVRDKISFFCIQQQEYRCFRSVVCFPIILEIHLTA